MRGGLALRSRYECDLEAFQVALFFGKKYFELGLRDFIRFA